MLCKHREASSILVDSTTGVVALMAEQHDGIVMVVGSNPTYSTSPEAPKGAGRPHHAYHMADWGSTPAAGTHARVGPGGLPTLTKWLW